MVVNMAMDTTKPVKNGGNSKWEPSYFLNDSI